MSLFWNEVRFEKMVYLLLSKLDHRTLIKRHSGIQTQDTSTVAHLNQVTTNPALSVVHQPGVVMSHGVVDLESGLLSPLGANRSKGQEYK